MLSESKFEKEGLTFDDVLLIPGKSDVTPNMINLGTRLAGGITLKTPIMTAAMDTVTAVSYTHLKNRLGYFCRSGVIRINKSFFHMQVPCFIYL